MSDHWLAVAEQQGAIKALREAAVNPEIVVYMYKYFDNHPMLAPAAVNAAVNYLLDRADQLEDGGHTALPKLPEALQAVLDLHERMEHGVHHYGLQEHPDWCAACSEPVSGISIPYPCPPVQAIYDHLGEKE